ncbi:hypothetical protein NE865_03410 [Phthorimaea operculella]|nr:hypothetical protein NE865_03410 [Phthorimaea operculella]
MARIYVALAMFCYLGLASAQQYVSYPYVYPGLEHRSVRALRDEPSLQEYDLQVIPTPSVRSGREAEEVQEVQEVVAYDPVNTSLLGLVWQFLPSPIVALKTAAVTVISKIWKLVKFLLPVELVVLGMGLVLGFCGLTPYCTLIIEEPIASKIRAIKSNIPYIDEIEYYVHEAIHNVQALQLL